MARPSRSIALLALVLLVSTGCRTWRAESRAPTSPVWRNLPGEIRITLEDCSKLTLEQPVIRFDQTIRSQGGGPAAALQDISAVEARRFSTVRTFGLVLAKASVVIHVLSLIVDGQPHYRGLF